MEPITVKPHDILVISYTIVVNGGFLYPPFTGFMARLLLGLYELNTYARPVVFCYEAKESKCINVTEAYANSNCFVERVILKLYDYRGLVKGFLRYYPGSAFTKEISFEAEGPVYDVRFYFCRGKATR